MPPQQGSRSPGISVVSSPRNRFTGLKDNREIGACAVSQVGLRKFIEAIVEEIDLNLTDNVEFNLNDRGLLYKWKDVYEVEATYAKCLGISRRLYNCHTYTHEVTSGLTYFVLEEYNERTYSFLPEFKFHVIIFCWYDMKTRAVTKVMVQYDQHSFFLHCFGAEKMWRWAIANILTPPAQMWAKAYFATGMVNPFTFLAQIILFAWCLSKIFST